MNAKVELAGQRFGSLTVIEHSPRNEQRLRTHWVCKCDCGRKLLVRSDNLRKGRSTKCSHCRGNIGRLSVFVEEGEKHD